MSGRESLIPALSEPQRRHLRELFGDGSRTLYWKPANAGEERCAHALQRKGLVAGSFVSYSDGYWLTEEGLRIGRALAEAESV